MQKITIRLEDEQGKKIKKLAKQNKESLTKYLRKVVDKGMAIIDYEKQNPDVKPEPVPNVKPEPVIANIDQKKKSELSTKYERNLEFFTIETDILLRLIVSESGKFTEDEATQLLAKAQQKTEEYMKFYKDLTGS